MGRDRLEGCSITRLQLDLNLDPARFWTEESLFPINPLSGRLALSPMPRSAICWNRLLPFLRQAVRFSFLTWGGSCPSTPIHRALSYITLYICHMAWMISMSSCCCPRQASYVNSLNKLLM